MRDYNDYSDYESYDSGGNFKKFKTKGKKPKFKGHQSKRGESDYWTERMIQDLESTEVNSNIPFIPNPRPVGDNVDHKFHRESEPVYQAAAAQSQFVPGPNTHTIKNNQIDFDRVAEITKVSGEHNGRMTYGIKFLFTGKKGLFRVIWFNVNERERDSVFNAEYSFWAQLTTTK